MVTTYAYDPSQVSAYPVTFLNAAGVKLTRHFNSEYKAWCFVNKLKHSKRCTLVAYPLFK